MEIYYTLEVSNDGISYQEVSCKSAEWVAATYEDDAIAAYRAIALDFESCAYDVISNLIDDYDDSPELNTFVRIDLVDGDYDSEIRLEDFGSSPAEYRIEQGLIRKF